MVYSYSMSGKIKENISNQALVEHTCYTLDWRHWEILTEQPGNQRFLEFANPFGHPQNLKRSNGEMFIANMISARCQSTVPQPMAA